MRDKLILRELSENSRATITQLAKVAKCSRVTAERILRRLSSDLKIKFTLEFDLDELSISRHAVIIKFSKKPDSAMLERILDTETYSMSAFLTEGSFDLMVLAVAPNPVEYMHWETVLEQKLAEYEPKSRDAQNAVVSFGFVTVKPSFVDMLYKLHKIDEADKDLLRLLNENSRLSYSELSRLTKMHIGTIRYRLFALKKNGVIKRYTIAVQKPPHGYILSFFEKFTYVKEFENDAAVARAGFINADKEMPLLTTFQYVAPSTGSYSACFLALFGTRKQAMEDVIINHRRIYRREKVEIRYARVTELLTGSFPFRNIDIKTNYKIVKWE